MINRFLKHSEVLGSEYSNGALSEPITYYLPSPRLGDSFAVYLDSPNDIVFNTNDPNVPILANQPPSQTYVLEGKPENIGNSVVLRCLGSAWRVTPRFF